MVVRETFDCSDLRWWYELECNSGVGMESPEAGAWTILDMDTGTSRYTYHFLESYRDSDLKI